MTLVPTPQQISGLPTDGIPKVPKAMPKSLRTFLEACAGLLSSREALLTELEQEYEATSDSIKEKYKPDGVDEAFWSITKPLMIHMNTTQIAVRSLEGVYSGSQIRRIEGKGKYIEELREFINGNDYRQAMPDHYVNAVLYGSSAISAFWDFEQEQLCTNLHDPVRMRLYSEDGNVKRLIALIDKDRHGRYLKFSSLAGVGTLYASRDAIPGEDYFVPDQGLPFVLTSVAYGRDRRNSGNIYGKSLVAQTVGYNRILTNCYYILGLLIKWQGKSLLLVTSGEKGGTDALPKNITNISGTTALLMDQNSDAKFLSPDPKFSEILSIINSYLSFLAVAIGIPKSMFQAQDNVSAQSARLEGAPMVSLLRRLARYFETCEKDFIYRAAAMLHIQKDGRAFTWKQIQEMYKPSVRLEPWDYTDDVYSNASAVVSLVNNGIVRLVDAVRKANPEMTEDEVIAFVEERQNKLAEEMMQEKRTNHSYQEGKSPDNNQEVTDEHSSR